MFPVTWQGGLEAWEKQCLFLQRVLYCLPRTALYTTTNDGAEIERELERRSGRVEVCVEGVRVCGG